MPVNLGVLFSVFTWWRGRREAAAEKEANADAAVGDLLSRLRREVASCADLAELAGIVIDMQRVRDQRGVIFDRQWELLVDAVEARKWELSAGYAGAMLAHYGPDMTGLLPMGTDGASVVAAAQMNANGQAWIDQVSKGIKEAEIYALKLKMDAALRANNVYGDPIRKVAASAEPEANTEAAQQFTTESRSDSVMNPNHVAEQQDTNNDACSSEPEANGKTRHPE